jgi:hypothetical protein
MIVGLDEELSLAEEKKNGPYCAARVLLVAAA